MLDATVAPSGRAVARVLHARVLVDDRGHNFHFHAAYGERVARPELTGYEVNGSHSSCALAVPGSVAGSFACIQF